MTLGLVVSDGQKCPIIFTAVGEKVSAEVYQQLLSDHVLPWLIRTYPDGNYVFQQDIAPAHTAKSTQDLLSGNMADYWSKELWPPLLPDLNPLDYSIWSVMQLEVRVTAHSDISSLK